MRVFHGTGLTGVTRTMVYEKRQVTLNFLINNVKSFFLQHIHGYVTLRVSIDLQFQINEFSLIKLLISS
jgi:hypothetical protein